MYHCGMHIDADALSFNLRRHRKKRGLTQRRLGEMAGGALSAATISRIEDGEISSETEGFIPPLALALGVPIEALIQWQAGQGPRAIPRAAGVYPPSPFTLLSHPVLTGGADPNQGVDMAVNDDIFVVRVDGDCLEPEIEGGTFLLMSRTKPAVIGEVVLVAVNGEYHLKRLMQRNGMTELSSRLGPLTVPSDGIQYLGTMIDRLRRQGG